MEISFNLKTPKELPSGLYLKVGLKFEEKMDPASSFPVKDVQMHPDMFITILSLCSNTPEQLFRIKGT
jgi:hypothetical protein